MNKIRIMNKTSASIILEDLGITLQRSGGIDSSCVVSEREFFNSKDVKKYSNWLRFDVINQPMFNKYIPPETQKRTSYEPSTPPIPTVVTDKSEITMLHETVQSINEKMSKMIELLSYKQSERVVNVYGDREFSNSIAQSRSIEKIESEPVFIPSTIIPKDVKTRISVKKSETDSVDFDSTASALKKLRKK